MHRIAIFQRGQRKSRRAEIHHTHGRHMRCSMNIHIALDSTHDRHAVFELFFASPLTQSHEHDFVRIEFSKTDAAADTPSNG
jgi:hypothetical protein